MLLKGLLKPPILDLDPDTVSARAGRTVIFLFRLTSPYIHLICGSIMKRLAIGLLCLAGLLGVHQVQAQGFGNVSLAARVGSLGPGLELTTSITPNLNLRAAGHYLGYDRQDTITDLEIKVQSDASLKLASGALFVDYFPARRGFRLTGGLVLNQNEATVLITPLESYKIDEKEFSPEKIGTLTAVVGHKSQLNPYLGLGFGNSVHPGAKLGLVFDLGVLYTDSPSVEMAGTGMIAPTADQAPQVEEDLKGIKLYPLLSIGLSYKI